MAHILVIYSSTDGHTAEICRRLKEVFEKHMYQVALLGISEARSVDLTGFDRIVIGASIRYGRHSSLVVDFVNQNKDVLDSKPNAFFSVNIVARKANKNRPETNPYLKKFLKQIAWRPQHLAVFAGKLDYPRYTVLDRTMIRLIMCITGGPTDPTAVIDFTDWSEVEAFGKLISRL